MEKNYLDIYIYFTIQAKLISDKSLYFPRAYLSVQQRQGVIGEIFQMFK